MTLPIKHFLASLTFLLFLSACASGEYIKNAPPSYPHENPTDKESDGKYLSDSSNTTNTPSTTDSPSTSDPHAWKHADNGQYYKVGDPYKIGGRWYRPKEYTEFSQSGVASWYGPNFHLKKTANGGIFDKNIPSAAHKTLPIPSVIRVTNNNNSKSIVVKVNDRGPYSKARILDLSEKAAEILDFKENGTANITIAYLHKESQELKNQMNSPSSSSKNTKITPNSSSISPTNTIVTTPTITTPTTTTTPKVSTPIIGSRKTLSKNPFPFSIQVGAFSQKNNAQKLQKYLKDFYNDVVVVPSARFFKVFIGFSSLNDANNHLIPVRNNHDFPSAFIVKP